MYFLHCFEVSPQRQLDPEGLLIAVHTKYQGPENKKQQLEFSIFVPTNNYNTYCIDGHGQMVKLLRIPAL